MAVVNGRYPVSIGRVRDAGVELEFPIGQESGKPGCFQTLTGEGLFVNTLVCGGKGKGKTAGLVKPFISFTAWHPQRVGALIYDVKGDLAPFTLQAARAVGREDDVRIIDPDGEFRLRLFQAGMPAETMANMVVTAIGSIIGGHSSREAFWIQSAEELLKFLIILLRMSSGDDLRAVTPHEILSVLGQDDAVQRLVNKLNNMANSGAFADEEQKHNVCFINMYHERNTNLDSRVKTSVEAEINRFLRDFSGYKMARTFCPGPNEPCVSVEEIINDGAIVILNMPQCRYGELSRFVGMVIKAQFYNAVMRRLTDPRLDPQRPVFFICDEYQNFATVGGSVGADDQFAALSRQARAGMFCATQELGSLYNAASEGKHEAVANLVQNFQNLVLLREDVTPRLKSLLTGKGLTDHACLAKLRPFEALFFKDADSDAKLLELGPHFSDWNHVRREDELRERELSEKRNAALGRLTMRGTK